MEREDNKASPSPLQFWHLSCSQCAAGVPLQLLQGETKEAGERLRHWEKPGSTHLSTQLQATVLLHRWGQNPSSDPRQVWGRPAHQPGSGFRPNTALASCCFPRSQAEATGRGARPLRPEGSPFGAGRCHRVSDCCWRGSASACVIRLQKDLPRGALSQHSTPSTPQNAKHPAGLCLGLAGKEEEEVSEGSKQHCRLFRHRRGTAAGAQHYPSQPSASAGSFCPVSDSLSVLWDEQFAQSAQDL